MLLPKFILIINARIGKIPPAQGLRETALGVSRHQLDEEAHPGAAALNWILLEADARQRYVSKLAAWKE